MFDNVQAEYPALSAVNISRHVLGAVEQGAEGKPFCDSFHGLVAQFHFFLHFFGLSVI